MKRWLTGLTLLLAAFGCGSGDNGNGVKVPPPSDAVLAFRKLALELSLRPDAGENRVEVQEILIGVNLDSALPSRKRMGVLEAEQLAAELLAKAQAGEDFDTLVYQYSWEGPRLGIRPGTTLYIRNEPDARRAPSVHAGGVLGASIERAVWRLKPGELGAVEFHRKDAEGGYYVLRRLTEAEMKADNPVNAGPASDDIKAMRDSARELLDRPELDTSTVKVRHVLVGRYAPGPSDDLKPLKPVAAEARAAELWREAAAGADFSAMMKHSYDSGPGEYTMTRENREGMARSFWSAAWRLKPGEVGVALYDRWDSPFGYHIIQRLE